MKPKYSSNSTFFYIIDLLSLMLGALIGVFILPSLVYIVSKNESLSLLILKLNSAVIIFSMLWHYKKRVMQYGKISLPLTSIFISGFSAGVFGLISFLKILVINNYYEKILINQREEYQQIIGEKQKELAYVYLKTIRSLALAIDAKDQYTHQHIIRVQRYAVAIGQKIGFTSGQLELLETSALLHDVGKIGVPEYILLKPGRLTDEEFTKVKQHPEIGAAILEPVDFPQEVIDGVKYHHEKWNGTGYPDGLKGNNIPLFARILAVADVYDALTTTRSYRKAWTHERAKEFIEKEKNYHFDVNIAEAFLQIIDGIVQEMSKEGIGPLIPISETVIESAPTIVQDMQRSSSELWALYEVAQTISPHLNLQDTLLLLGRKMENIITGTTSLFLLWNGDHKTQLIVKSASGLNALFFNQSLTISENSISFKVAQTATVYRGIFKQDDLHLNEIDEDDWTELRSAVILPIIYQNEILGTVNLYHTEPNAFQESDISLINALIDKIGQIIYEDITRIKIQKLNKVDNIAKLHDDVYIKEYIDKINERKNPFALFYIKIDNFDGISKFFDSDHCSNALRNFNILLDSFLGSQGQIFRLDECEFLLLIDPITPKATDDFISKLQRIIMHFDTDLVHPDLGPIHFLYRTESLYSSENTMAPQIFISYARSKKKRIK
jgi:putative nucleotidyltransferase with HDIG domain